MYFQSFFHANLSSTATYCLFKYRHSAWTKLLQNKSHCCIIKVVTFSRWWPFMLFSSMSYEKTVARLSCIVSCSKLNDDIPFSESSSSMQKTTVISLWQWDITNIHATSYEQWTRIYWKTGFYIFFHDVTITIW